MAVPETNIKFSELYTIINNTTHTDQSVSLSSFRGEGTVPTDTSAAIGISLHFKGKTFASTDHPTIETVKTKLTDANLGIMKTALVTGAGGTMYEINSDMAYELSSIHDGGNDIYDYGNKISFNSNSNYLTYKEEKTSNGVGTGSYFVRIGPSTKRFFIFVSDLDSSITNVQINGNLGADNQGSVVVGEETMTNNNIEYKIYWKSVHDGQDRDPTINHIWILRNASGISRTYASNTDNDNHKVTTNDVERIYYIMWAGLANDGHTSSTEVTALVSTFLGIIDGPENISVITSYGADDIAYINCTSVTSFNNKTFLEYISSHGVTGSSSNDDDTDWQNGYSGLISYDAKPLTSGNDYFKYDGDYGLRFIHGDGSVDAADWVVIDFGPLNNSDFDGYYQNTVGRYFGGENTASGGGGGIYTSSSNKGMLWGYNQGWKLLYQLPLGVRNSSYNKSTGKWFTSGGTMVTTGDGKRAEYDTMKLTHVGFSVGTPVI